MMQTMSTQRTRPPVTEAEATEPLSSSEELQGADATVTSQGKHSSASAKAHAAAPLPLPAAPACAAATGAGEERAASTCIVPDWHVSSRGKPKPASNPRKKERDPEAAARAAQGIRLRRMQDGLGCKVCEQVFPSRKELLKHIEKTGHVRDPEAIPGGLPNGMFYIPDGERARIVKGQLLIE